MADFLSATLVACRNGEGDLLMVQEGKDHVHGKWDFPGGALEHDESVKQCAEREVKEETGFIIEARGFYGVYLEKSDTSDLPVIAFLLDAEIVGDGEPDHHFEGEILDHGFFSPGKLKEMDLRKPNRYRMLRIVENHDCLDIERLEDTRSGRTLQ